MVVKYVERNKRLIGSNKQWIQGLIRNDEDMLNQAFDAFVDKLEKGENFLNALRDTQKEYDVQIDYDTVIFPTEDFQKSTLTIKVG